MLPWVVTFRSTLRRSRKSHSPCVLARSTHVSVVPSGRPPLNAYAKSFGLISFTDPHPLTGIESYRYKKGGGEGVTRDVRAFGRSSAQALSSSLESAVANKHRVLPVFSRNRPASTPLEATLLTYPVSVDSKCFTGDLSPLDATLTKNTGVGTPNVQRSTLNTFKRSERPIAAKRLWCHNPQRHQISLRSGETTPLPPVSNNMSADIGDRYGFGPLCKSCLGSTF